MSDNAPKATASIQITIEGNVSEREKQIIHLLLTSIYMTMMLPFAIKETETTAQEVRDAARVSSLLAVRFMASREFPDLTIQISDSELKVEL